jgi:hypothetical protein
MHFRWGELLLGVAALLGAEPAGAQVKHELGVQGIAAFSDPAVFVAGGYAAWRPSSRTRISGTGGVGMSDGSFVWRIEALGHFLLSPDEASRPGFYLTGGVAGTGGPATRGYLVAAVGLEQRPGGKEGWALEMGVGGGFRVGLGYRWKFTGKPGTQ